jgi:hypothetical protein
VTWNKRTEVDGSAVASPGGGAAFSKDGGRTFTYVDPETEKWGEANGGFCCDQRVLYSPSHDLWIWILQYWSNEDGNVLRVAVAHGDKGFDERDFSFYDLAPRSFAPQGVNWRRAFFDYPNVGLTNEHLFFSANVYPSEEDSLAASVVIRIPLTDLGAGKPPLQYLRFFRYPPNPSIPDDGENLTAVFAQGADSTMYFAQQVTDSKLREWTWPDSDPNARSVEVTHSRYLHGRQSCLRAGALPSSDWCQRSDERLSTGWVADGVIGFAWDAQQDPAHGLPYPFVMVVRVDANSKALVDEPMIWSKDHAYQYPALAPNAQGDIGGVALAGGGERFETCVALVLRRDGAGSKGPWRAAVVDASDSDPGARKSGDYLGAVRAASDANGWVGSCMTLHGGGGNGNAEVRLVSFAPKS